MQTTEQSRAAADAARALAGSRSLAMLTGAGISAESGVPTFRDAQTGLWARFDPLQLATPTAFAIRPKLVWDGYAWRRELVARVQPNPAHDALVAGTPFSPELATPEALQKSVLGLRGDWR